MSSTSETSDEIQPGSPEGLRMWSPAPNHHGVEDTAHLRGIAPRRSSEGSLKVNIPERASVTDSYLYPQSPNSLRRLPVAYPGMVPMEPRDSSNESVTTSSRFWDKFHSRMSRIPVVYPETVTTESRKVTNESAIMPLQNMDRFQNSMERNLLDYPGMDEESQKVRDGGSMSLKNRDDPPNSKRKLPLDYPGMDMEPNENINKNTFGYTSSLAQALLNKDNFQNPVKRDFVKSHRMESRKINKETAFMSSQDREESPKIMRRLPLNYPGMDMEPSEFAVKTASMHPIMARALSCGPRRNRGDRKPIPETEKDDKYFERRQRNNLAAKKSRDARKYREDGIATRAAFLEQEHAILQAQVSTLRDEATSLRQLLIHRRRNCPEGERSEHENFVYRPNYPPLQG